MIVAYIKVSFPLIRNKLRYLLRKVGSRLQVQVQYTDSANIWHPQKLHLCKLRKELSECTGKRVIGVFTTEGSKCAALCSLHASQRPRVLDIVLRVRPAPTRQGPKIRCPMQTRGWFHTPVHDRIQKQPGSISCFQTLQQATSALLMFCRGMGTVWICATLRFHT